MPSRWFAEVNLDIVGPLLPLAGVSLPAYDDQSEHQVAGGHRIRRHLRLRRGFQFPSDMGFKIRAHRDHGHGQRMPVYRRVVVHNV